VAYGGVLGVCDLNEDWNKKEGLAVYQSHEELSTYFEFNADDEVEKPSPIIDLKIMFTEQQVRDYLESLEDFSIEEYCNWRPQITVHLSDKAFTAAK